MSPNNPFKIGCKLRLITHFWKPNVEGYLVFILNETEGDLRYILQLTKPKKKAGILYAVQHSVLPYFEIIKQAPVKPEEIDLYVR